MVVRRRFSKAKEAADLMNVNLQRLYEICRTDSSFPKILVGQRQLRFDLDAVERWMNEGGSKQGVKHGTKQ